MKRPLPLQTRDKLERFCARRPDYRDGPLDSMLWVMVAVIAIAVPLFIAWGGGR